MNLRPSGYEPDELPDCSTPRQVFFSSLERDCWAFSRFGGDLLSRGLSPSTIGAAVLNFRVRDGTGCFTCAMTTKPRKIPVAALLCKARRVAGSVFACKCALPLGCYVTPYGVSHQSTLSNSRSVYAFDLSFHYWIKSSLSGD